jgi:Protein of unknown function (DUF1360)
MRVKRREISHATQVDVAVITDMLATYRLVRLYQTDSITEPVRSAVDDRLLAAGHHRALELSQCPWCLGVWVAFGVVAARHLTPRVWDMIARALAFSAVTGMVTEVMDQLDQ